MYGYGKGIIKGMTVTLARFFQTYWEDLSWFLRGQKRYKSAEGIAYRSGKDNKGIFTIQYPEEKLPPAEEFRYVPFLVYDEKQDGGKEVRCTSCGICAKVCPPQCIWIVRTSDPVTGKPIPEPADFTIDADVCMNCGLCAEYCPFDAIIMDHDYEIASYERNLLHMEKLLKPASYYKSIRPTGYAIQEEVRKAKEATRAAKADASAGN